MSKVEKIQHTSRKWSLNGHTVAFSDDAPQFFYLSVASETSKGKANNQAMTAEQLRSLCDVLCEVVDDMALDRPKGPPKHPKSECTEGFRGCQLCD